MNNDDGKNISGLKALLLRAWKERWSDVQWSIHCKRLIPKNDGSSSYTGNEHLVDLLLQQALHSSSPNEKLLTYLKCAISSQMVNYSCTFEALIQYNDISKPYCILKLLDLVKTFAPSICSRAHNEDSLVLGKSLINLLRWVYLVSYRAFTPLLENRDSAVHKGIIDLASDVIQALLDNKSTRALLFIAKQEEKADDFRKMIESEKKCQELIGRLTPSTLSASLLLTHNKNLHSITILCQLPVKEDILLDTSKQNLNISINVLLSQEAILQPTSDTQAVVEELLIIERTQGISRARLYCEMIRTCFLGLVDASVGLDDIKWAAFTFLKVPQLMSEIFKDTTGDRQSEILAGIELLFGYKSLLELVDHKTQSDCLSLLLNELSLKFSLLTEEQCKVFLQRRQKGGHKVKSPESGSGQQTPGLIMRAEPTVQSILKHPTLDADYSKNQGALLGVLCQMLSGKSFELILAAAAATGRLQKFAVKLIKFNEFAKSSPGENSKTAQTRALLFDITFLMLCQIMQLYGTEIISSSEEAQGSFFAQWTANCLPEDGKYKSREIMPPADPNKVEVLLGQFNPGGELKMNLTNWHDVCHNTPYAVQEVLIAWEHGVINHEKVKSTMDNVKSKMCCLPIVVTAWLSSYINMVDEDHRKKPLLIIQHLKKQGKEREMAQHGEINTYYTDRCHLMQMIMTSMTQGVLSQSVTQRSNPYALPPNTPVHEVLRETFHDAEVKGCVNLKAVHRLEALLNVGGPKWFCDHLVREVLAHDRIEDLDQGVSLLYALFHMDLETLTLTLLHHTVPSLLQIPNNDTRLTMLIDPRGKALAKLCIILLTMIHKLRAKNKESPIKRGKKRPRPEIEMPEFGLIEGMRPNKMRKTSLEDEGLGTFNKREMVTPGKDSLANLPNPTDPLHKALVNLFHLFQHILHQRKISQKSGLVMSFVEEAVKSGPDSSRFILQFMPLSLISSLMQVLPSEFAPELLLSVCDLTTRTDRKVAAKVVCQNARFHKQALTQNTVVL